MDKIKDNLLDVLDILKLGKGALYQKHLVKLSKKSRRQIQRDIKELSKLGYIKIELIDNNNVIYLTRKYYNHFFKIDKKTSNTKVHSTLIKNYLIAYANLSSLLSEFIENDIFNKEDDDGAFRQYLSTNESIKKFPALSSRQIYVDITEMHDSKKLIKVLIVKNDISESSFSKFIDSLITVLQGYELGKFNTKGQAIFYCFIISDEDANEFLLNKKNENFIFINNTVEN